jgi:hypothetical protein
VARGCANLSLQINIFFKKAVELHLTLLMASSHRLLIICCPHPGISVWRDMSRHEGRLSNLAKLGQEMFPKQSDLELRTERWLGTGRAKQWQNHFGLIEPHV